MNLAPELLGMGALAVAGTLWWITREPPAPTTRGSPAPLPGAAAPPAWPEPTLQVLDFQALLQTTGTAGALARIEGASGLNAATWQELVLPVLHNVAELVQLLPASEAHHHAQPGGLWVHTCETLGHAVQYRAAFVLPPAQDADDVARARHRWTAGVMIGALLHDVGKTVTDVRVRLYGPDCTGASWSAMAGTMGDAGATDYAVSFPPESERDYRAHQRLGALLLQKLVPPDTLVWLSDDKALLDQLLQYLLGEARPDNPIATIVARAEAESVRTNLREGPRTRFATARAVPLIERLMAALRRMLAEGGVLPLNRPGAAGYVFEGEVWFAAARLANAVREYLVANESAVGIPGEDKNDRLFDAWQDYGACLTNPASGRALFGGRIEFDDGIGPGYELPAMLRFPLAKLYPDAAQFPAAMPGRVIAIATAAKPGADTALTPSAPGATGPLSSSKSSPCASSAPAPAVPAADPGPDAADTPAGEQFVQASTDPAASARELRQFLDDEDVADLARIDRVAPGSRCLAPVAPSVTLPVKADSDKAVPERAMAFMRWVQTKVADGSLPYNAAGAMVHFVRRGDATALLLVSPVIFRRYEEALGETHASNPGLATQRAFTAAGWHLRAKGGKNITSYQVMRSGGKGGNLLNGFLLLEPERFFVPVPPANERLIAWNTAPSEPREDP